MFVAVGSTQFAKVQAVKQVAKLRQLRVIACPAHSSVSSQPLSDLETMEGALNRARYVLDKTGCAIGIGLEGGMMSIQDRMFVCNWGALVSEDQVEVVTGGLRFPLPEDMSEELLHGKELSEIIAKHPNQEARSQQHELGTVGLMTNGFVTRKDMYVQMVTALFGQYDTIRKRF